MKKFLSVFMAITMIIVINLQIGISSLAGAFTTHIKAFTYKGFEIPEYDGDMYEVINSNNPDFSSSELNQNIYEKYSALDSLGRVGICSANIDRSLMPTEPRGDISSVKPTGWMQNRYDFVSGTYVYNRCHLIGFQLTGENANKKNLMTGTRSFNIQGMLPFENMIAGYIKQDAENNVLYRVTPVFQGDNLLATGVIMEAESVDDLGESVKFCVFVYNVEKGVSIDYKTGDNTQATYDNIHDIKSANVSVEKCTYTGQVLRPKVTVSYNGKKLEQDVDYKLSYSANKNAGKGKATIRGKGSYGGTLVKEFTISKAKYTPNISSVTHTYNGNSHCISMDGIKSGSVIEYKTDKNGKYTEKKPTRKNVGKTTVYYRISNPNYLTISSSKTITVLPRNVTGFKIAATKNGFKASWTSNTVQTTGYRLRYSTKSNMSNAKSIKIKNNKTSKTVKKLKKGKKYYVQIQTYKTVKGTNYYSPCPTAKCVIPG